jgi:tetratricopeptide (TPR) repeat protein
VGPLGIGKSRLRQEALRRLAVELPDLSVWAVRGDPDRSDAPLELIASLVRKIALIDLPAPTGPRSPEELRGMIESRVRRSVPAQDAPRVARHLAEVAHVAFPEGSAGHEDHGGTTATEGLLGALSDLVRAEAARGPLLLVLEDLHFADAASVSLLGEVLEAARESPIVLWAVGRPELVDRLATWDTRGIVTAHVTVGELSPEGGATLASALLGQEGSQRLARTVAQRALGTPLFIEELAMSVAEGVDEDASQAVLGLVTTRLAGLGAVPRMVVRAAAIVGVTFWRGALAALLPTMPARKIDAALGALVASGFVDEHRSSRFPGERELGFRHDVVRDAALGLSTEEDRERGHGVVARWLEASGERDASVVATHFVRAGLGHLAADHYARSAERALAAGDLEEAAHRASRGLSCSTDAPVTGWLSLLRADALLRRGEHREALMAGRLAMRSLETVPGFPSERWYVAAAVTAEAAGVERDLGTLLDVAASVLAEHEEGTPTRARAVAAARAAEALFSGGLAPEAGSLSTWLETVEPLFAGDPDAHGRVLRALGLASIAAGDPSAARRRLETASTALERGGAHDLAVDCVLGAARCALDLGQAADAEIALRRCVADLRGRRPGPSAVAAASALAVALGRRGAFSEALASGKEAVNLAANLGDRKLEGSARVEVSRLLRQSGDAKGAIAEAETAISLLSSAPDKAPFAQAALADALRISGDVRGAVTASEEATRATFRSSTLDGDPTHIHLATAEALLAAANLPLALAAVGRAAGAIRQARARIADGPSRESFVSAVPERARVRALAREHGLEAP